jgi:hypothetical protein
VWRACETAGHSAAKDSAHTAERNQYGKSPMTDHSPALYQPDSLRFTFSALWRVVVILSLVWAVGGSFDGADLQELIAVPLVMAAWALGFFILDRWVVKADQNRRIFREGARLP